MNRFRRKEERNTKKRHIEFDETNKKRINR